MPGKATKDFIAALPKTEIHIHAEAMVSFESAHLLNQKHGVNPSLKSPKDFHRLFEINSLKDMIKNFLFLQTLFRKPEDYAFLVEDIGTYCRENSIRYMEAHLSPSMVLQQGFVSFEELLDSIIGGLDGLEATGGPIVRLIVDLSRTFGHDNAQRNLDMVLDYRKRRPAARLLGVGLGGQEVGHSCKDYADLLVKARGEGLHVVVHAGEEVGPESIWDALDACKAERIGHATSAITDPKLMDRLKAEGVPLEICPTSNVVTKKFVKSYATHPMIEYYKKGLMVTVNTDDPNLFNISLDAEYCHVAKEMGFKHEDIVKLLANNIHSTFLEDARKAVLEKELQATARKLST